MFPYGQAICYSGYRENQSPRTKTYPSEAEVLEDLLLLAKNFKYIRMYDPYTHAKTVLQVIKEHKIPLQVMVGVEPRGEISNPSCPWGGLHSDEAIKEHKKTNYDQLDLLAKLCNEYGDIILAASVGNENTSSWHHNLMDPKTIALHAKYLKSKISQPVTFCEGAHNWQQHGQVIAKEVDFISIHSYPVWLKTSLKNAVQFTIEDYQKTKQIYPNTPIVFTEFGWATMSNGPMIKDETNEKSQKTYLDEIMAWSQKEKISMFIFEAFDEPWKGSNQPDEPEKHWGIYDVHRKPKLWAKNSLK